MIDQATIACAIDKHGACKVYRLCIDTMESKGSLQEIGITSENMGDVYAIMSAAYDRLSPADKAIDYAQAGSALEQIANK